MDLLILNRNGVVLTDLGGLIQSAHGSRAKSSSSETSASESKVGVVGDTCPEWLRRPLSELSKSDGWLSVRSPDHNDGEYWCHILQLDEDQSKTTVLVVHNWIPQAQLVEGPSSLATIIHDLKNPIGAMFGYADALLDTDLGKGLEAQHTKIIDRIRKASARSLDLLKNYESLLYIGRRRQVAVSDLNHMVSLVMETSDIQRDHHAPISVEQTTQELMVTIQRFSLDRIVANLLGNAVKYTPAEALITVRTLKEGDSGVLEIENTAPEIAVEERESIFEARKRGSTGRDIAGTGMGLYTVKMLVQNASGSIELKSNGNGGNIFRVTLPLAPEQTQEAAARSKEILPE